MKYFLYCILTQLIIWLGWLREKVMNKSWRSRRYDRTFYASNNECWTCCDCKLEHITYPLPGEETKNPAFRFVPVRIKDYSYRFRSGSGGSSPSVDESKTDVWTGKPKT